VIARIGEIVTALLIIALLAGCETDFNPKGVYREKLVVYSILIAKTDTQYVRVYTTYDPPAFDPFEITSENIIRNATVTLRYGNTTVRFRDTTITRDDPRRYGPLLPVYVAHPFKPELAEVYTLTIQTPSHGTMTATTSMPGRGDITVLNPYVVQSPQAFDENILISARITPFARGYLLRMYLDFEVLVAGQWSPRRREVPKDMFEVGAERKFIYPQLERRTTTPSSPRSLEAESVVFLRTAFNRFLDGIRSEFGADRVRLVRAVFLLTQVDANLYTYFNVVNGFQDQYSIRTDQPDYSNIRGGIGVFGAMTEDSAGVSLVRQ